MHQAGCTKHLPLQTHTNPLESGTGMCLPKFGTEMETNLWIEKRLLETNQHCPKSHEPQQAASDGDRSRCMGSMVPIAFPKMISLAK